MFSAIYKFTSLAFKTYILVSSYVFCLDLALKPIICVSKLLVFLLYACHVDLN